MSGIVRRGVLTSSLPPPNEVSDKALRGAYTVAYATLRELECTGRKNNAEVLRRELRELRDAHLRLRERLNVAIEVLTGRQDV